VDQPYSIDRTAVIADPPSATLKLRLELKPGAPEKRISYLMTEAQALELMAQLSVALVRRPA
jgi:hypothetical protein